MRNRQLKFFWGVLIGPYERNGLFCAKLRYSPCPRNPAPSLLKSFTSPAFAKINLGLHVLRKRIDGYHDLETVFLRIGWKDEVTFETSPSKNTSAPPSITMSCSDPRLPVNETNLCISAARALLEDGSKERLLYDDLHIKLNKHIPYGAGLGGGSSDAATVLKSCSALWGINSDLKEIGGRLGSDVPFFLGSGVAFGAEKGDVLSDITFPPALRGTRLLVVVPEQRVSTPDAYRMVLPMEDGREDIKKLVTSGTLADWRAHLTNDFEHSVFAQYPAIQQLKADFVRSGAAYASMSGSGSAVFGVFHSHSDSLAALSHIQSRWPSFSYWEGVSDAAV